MSDRGIKLPGLEFFDEPISALVERIADNETLLVTDPYNFAKLSGHKNTVIVRNNDCEQIPLIKENHRYSRIVAVGGCAALDIGRACAGGKPIIVIPAILSTSCISLDRSVIKYDGVNRLEKTTLPEKVMISMKDLLGMPQPELSKWCQSGFGDLFTMIAASIDLQYKLGDMSRDKVIDNVRECFDALDWVIKKFDGYNEISVRALAEFLHESSLVVVLRDNSALNAAGEHVLYHALLKLQPQYTSSRPTHGQIVSAGTILAVYIYGVQTNDMSLYEKLKTAFAKLGLPLSYSELSNAGIEKHHLIEGLASIAASGTHLSDHFKTGNFDILDRVFIV